MIRIPFTPGGYYYITGRSMGKNTNWGRTQPRWLPQRISAPRIRFLSPEEEDRVRLALLNSVQDLRGLPRYERLPE